MSNLYDGLPKTIFGLTCPQHRVLRVREFLDHHEVPFLKKATKPTLLKHLVTLQARYLPDELIRVASWFLGGEDTVELDKALASMRNARQPSKSPPSYDEDLNQSEIECSVCMLKMGVEQYPQDKLSSSCAHNPTICLACLSQSLEHQIEEKPWDHVACPECPARLSFTSIKQFATEQSFTRYDHKAVIASLQNIPNFTMCLGPECDSGQVHEGGDKRPIMTCTSCKFKTCFTHKIPWHKGFTCEEYDLSHTDRGKQEKASKDFLEQRTKVCPYETCGVHIDKTGGCDHMTCYRCGYEFCWLCFAPYQGIRGIRLLGNEVHQPQCQYYRPRSRYPRYI